MGEITHRLVENKKHQQGMNLSAGADLKHGGG